MSISHKHQQHHRSWATFYCESCEEVFADVLPHICEELPRCPCCAGPTHIWEILASYWKWAA